MKLRWFYWFKTPWTLVYMLQQYEYNPYKFADWVNTIPNVSQVRQRGSLVLTARVKLMLAVAYLSWGLFVGAGIILTIIYGVVLPLLLVVLAPLACVLSLFFATLLLQRLIVRPGQKREISLAKRKLATSAVLRIAVMGSYGKTTMKELLLTVLSQSKRVAATPGNKNVLISHARWVNQELKGDEDILIFEFGEAEPGDIQKLAGFSEPTHAIVTGLAPAHLDGYKSLKAVIADFASIKGMVEPTNIFVNGEVDDLVASFEGSSFYTRHGIDGLTIRDVNISLEGTSFSVVTKGKTLKLQTGLLGKHQLGPLCAVIAVARRLGLSDEEITAGVAMTRPFEHRMELRQVAGAWIIDDTYNGNIEGMRAGLELLQDLPAKRKVYVTPGLVDQGDETEAVHEELGRLIAGVQPDRVVLMRNSVSEIIATAMQTAGYKGELLIEDNPLEFYTNMEHFLAAGDVVMLQNDWPDAYA